MGGGVIIDEAANPSGKGELRRYTRAVHSFTPGACADGWWHGQTACADAIWPYRFVPLSARRCLHCPSLNPSAAPSASLQTVAQWQQAIIRSA